jgi:hypothetical protein
MKMNRRSFLLGIICIAFAEETPIATASTSTGTGALYGGGGVGIAGQLYFDRWDDVKF